MQSGTESAVDLHFCRDRKFPFSAETRCQCEWALNSVQLTYKTEREVVVEVIGLLRGGLSVCIGRVDLHFVLRLEKDSGCEEKLL